METGIKEYYPFLDPSYQSSHNANNVHGTEILNCTPPAVVAEALNHLTDEIIQLLWTEFPQTQFLYEYIKAALNRTIADYKFSCDYYKRSHQESEEDLYPKYKNYLLNRYQLPGRTRVYQSIDGVENYVADVMHTLLCREMFPGHVRDLFQAKLMSRHRVQLCYMFKAFFGDSRWIRPCDYVQALQSTKKTVTYEMTLNKKNIMNYMQHQSGAGPMVLSEDDK
jgi:hypothetical protein